jgi:hypothetical protein
MISRSPAENYIKYMLLHPEEYSDLQIQQRLDQEGLDFIGLSYFQRLRENIPPPPETFLPFSREHLPSVRYLRAQKLQLAFQADKAMRNAVVVLRTPRAKEFLETMLIAGATDLIILSGISNYGAPPGFDGTAIARYKHYFLNLALVSATELRALIDLRSEACLRSIDPVVRSQASAIKRASYHDPRRLAVAAPGSPVAAIVAQLQMGRSVPATDRQKLASRVLDVLLLRAAECAETNGMMMAENIGSIMSAVESTIRCLEKIGSPTETMLGQLEKIRLQSENKPISSLRVISGGRHTMELIAVPKTTEPEEK